MLDKTKERFRAKLYQPVNGIAQMAVIAICLAVIAIIMAANHAH